MILNGTSCTLNPNLVTKILGLLDHGLVRGLGNPKPGEMCVEAVICNALGLPHNDNPPCVGSSFRAAKIRLNDSRWSSNEARAEGMKKVAIAQLGSNELDQIEFSERLAFKTNTKLIPVILRDRGFVQLALDCEGSVDLKDCVKNSRAAAADAAYAAADAADAADATYAAADAAYAAAYAAAAADAAYAAAYAAAAADAAYAAGDAAYAAGDKYLLLFADILLEVAIEMKSPGCEFLYLVEENL